ncbi:hypothetical protein GCM10010339_52180 [Streptomyces alanosinicus]|uniref:Uncharacterized protein n=1 Tax=Streptomyces alanosinicus TaxID=68171 RepID=A0A919D5X2_9ACTN|nr:hypothetical protein GCM10010339_52180 [Streptomyces alanosinicus]
MAHELSAAAAALAARCEPRVNELARRMARDVLEQLRGYAELPAGVKDMEIAATARHGMRLFLRGAGGSRPRRDEQEYFRDAPPSAPRKACRCAFCCARTPWARRSCSARCARPPVPRSGTP